jgi:Mg-chelatase subunit ChlD
LVNTAAAGPADDESIFQNIPQAFAQFKSGFLGFLKRFARPRTRVVRGSRRRKTVISYRSGRNVKSVRYQPGENVLSALLTVLRAAGSGRYCLATGKYRIGDGDLMGWEKLERQSLTLVLAVDASASTHPFINIFAEILNSLTGHFRRHQDRIGLVSLHGRSALVLNHPTHNYRVVSRNLRRMKIQGMTPLADGLEKALAVIRLERQRKPGSRNLAVLLSDCYPEPLTHQYTEIFDEPAYRRSLQAAAHFRQQRVSLLVINPSFKHSDQSQFLPGERLSAALARESRGRLIKIFRNEFAPDAFTRAYSPPSRREIERILSGVEGMLAGRGGPEREGALP